MKQKEVIGIIGGLGPASTVDYYEKIIEKYRNLNGKDEYPNIIINSLNMTEIISHIELAEYEILTEKFIENIAKLQKAGATIGAISSNTPHIIFNEINIKSSIPLISIVTSTVKEAKNKGYKRVLLTGTIFTMSNDFYQKEFEKQNIGCIVPNEEDKQIIHNIIFPSLENGIVLEEDKLKFKKIVEKIISEEDIDAVILGCTELPLLIKGNDLSKPILDTTGIHIDRIVNQLLSSFQ